MISVAVTARAFSNSVVLRKELLKRYPDAKFNEEGTQLSGVDLISYLQGCEVSRFYLRKEKLLLLQDHHR